MSIQRPKRQTPLTLFSVYLELNEDINEIPNEILVSDITAGNLNNTEKNKKKLEFII